SQQRSDKNFRLACELVRNDRLGKLKQVNVWLPMGMRGGPFSVKPVPAGLDWEMWLGQTPLVDYVPERCHHSFRYWWEYSGGTMTDWGASSRHHAVGHRPRPQRSGQHRSQAAGGNDPRRVHGVCRVLGEL